MYFPTGFFFPLVYNNPRHNKSTHREGQAVKVIELLKSKEWSGKVIDCVLRFALSFALAGAQVFGGYAPLALGMIGA